MTSMSIAADLSSPASRGFSITPSDTADLPAGVRAIWVGGAGNISVILADDADPVLLSAVPAGTLLPLMARRVRATGTTATSIVGLR
jgi:hypothetical protein